MPRVVLLKPGSLVRSPSGEILDARSTVSLIVSGELKIMVDSGAKGDAGQITAALAREGLSPGDIDILVNTHSHSDHTENNWLFSGAAILAPKEGQIIAAGVLSMDAPGHTSDSIAVVVRAYKTVVIAGDALPTFSNYVKGVPPALHINREQAVSSMMRIIDIADIVIPGHDRPFSVADKKYIEL